MWVGGKLVDAETAATGAGSSEFDDIDESLLKRGEVGAALGISVSYWSVVVGIGVGMPVKAAWPVLEPSLMEYTSYEPQLSRLFVVPERSGLRSGPWRL